jgi:hypothetical protein
MSFALRRCHSNRVLTDCQDFVEHVVANGFSGGLHASEQFDTRPDENILGDAGLSALRLAPDEDRGDVLREEGFVELSIEEHPSSMTDYEVVDGWTFEGAQSTSSLQHLGERLSESLAARDEGAVKIKKFHVAPVALGESEPIPSCQVMKEGGVSECILVHGGTVPTIEKCCKLVQISTEDPLEPFWLVELCPEGTFCLTKFIAPDNVSTARAVHDVASYVVVGSAPSGQARARRVRFSANVDFL